MSMGKISQEGESEYIELIIKGLGFKKNPNGHIYMYIYIRIKNQSMVIITGHNGINSIHIYSSMS